MIAALRRLAAALGRRPLLRFGAIGFACGALGFALFGSTPRSQHGAEAAPQPFLLPAAPAGSADALATLAADPLWASQPAASAAALVEPPPRLVGIVNGPGQARLGVFEWPDGRRQRVGVGDTLPGQGVVASIDATSVRWRNAERQAFEARLYQNPEPRALAPRTPPPSP